MSQKDWWNARFSNDKNIISQGGQAETAKILTDTLWVAGVKDFHKILGQAKGRTCLDLGCGFGQLSRHFDQLGFEVTAVDFSENALAVLKSHSPHIKTAIQDITRPLPFGDMTFDVVIANLCLHYFCKRDTENAIAEINRVLKPGGLLIGSVLSQEEFEVVKDVLEFVEIEPNFYHEIFDDGRKKHVRFFNREDIEHFFAGFEVLYLENKFEQRMGKAKGAWEFILKNNG